MKHVRLGVELVMHDELRRRITDTMQQEAGSDEAPRQWKSISRALSSYGFMILCAIFALFTSSLLHPLLGPEVPAVPPGHQLQ